MTVWNVENPFSDEQEELIIGWCRELAKETRFTYGGLIVTGSLVAKDILADLSRERWFSVMKDLCNVAVRYDTSPIVPFKVMLDAREKIFNDD